MTDLPILFSRPMVLALLREVEAPGTGKTQTRRILKPQPLYLHGIERDEKELHATLCSDGVWRVFDPNQMAPVSAPLKVRFRKGDRLWVRETFSGPHCMEESAGCAAVRPSKWGKGSRIWYWADGNPAEGDWTKPKVSIHMPRWASRLTLTVTDVRVQRLLQISEEDAEAEGVERIHALHWPSGDPGYMNDVARRNFCGLWRDINGGESWAANSWVVAVTFTVAKRNIDHVFPSSPRLSPDATYYICDQCHREWKPGEDPGCPECLAAWHEIERDPARSPVELSAFTTCRGCANPGACRITQRCIEL